MLLDFPPGSLYIFPASRLSAIFRTSCEIAVPPPPGWLDGGEQLSATLIVQGEHLPDPKV